MRFILTVSSILVLLSACATLSRSHAPFKNTAAAEAHLRLHKSCPACDLRKAELSYSDLRGADLRGADLRGADFTRADLRGANLKGASLVRADLSTAPRLEGADLSDTDLTEANILPSELSLALTCGAILPDGKRNTPCPKEN